jgi:NADH-quinone oxidoreductase subunit E
MTPDSVEAAVQQAGSGLEPMRLDSPRGPVDDLTVISGIGPGNQQELNALGIYHYWQIAGWTPENVAWISNRVRFPKRIVRENWMSQAARLARLQ